MEEKPTADRVMTRRGQEQLRQDPRLHPNKYTYKQIKFFAGVNAKLGLVGVEIESTTPGFKPDRQYYVSRGWGSRSP